MKKMTVCLTRVRSRLVWSTGRIRSMEAPVVPRNEARTDPMARKAVLVSGVASRSPVRRIPPAITKRPARRMMNETYSSPIRRSAGGSRTR